MSSTMAAVTSSPSVSDRFTGRDLPRPTGFTAQVLAGRFGMKGRWAALGTYVLCCWGLARLQLRCRSATIMLVTVRNC